MKKKQCKSVLILTLILCFSTGYSQNNPSYINIAIGTGSVFNADKGFLKRGLGGNVSFLIPAGREKIPFSGADYFTFNAEVMSYPHSDQPYKWMINNGIDDSFNYAKAMVGFRFATRMPEEGDTYYYYRRYKPIEGSSFEPRIGLVLFDNRNLGGAFSAQYSYTRKGFQLSAYGLYGKATRHTNIGYTQIFVVGLSLGYTIPLGGN